MFNMSLPTHAKLLAVLAYSQARRRYPLYFIPSVIGIYITPFLSSQRLQSAFSSNNKRMFI